MQLARVICILFTGALGACASVRPAPVDFYLNVTNEVADLDAEIARNRAAHTGLLAPGELDQAQLHVKRAAERRARIEPRDDVVRELGLAHAHLDRAAEVVRTRSADFAELFVAREAALDAGILRVGAGRAALSALDARIRRGEADGETRRNELSEAYRALERVAVVARELKVARADVDEARAQNAMKIAPASLATAEHALRVAESIVARHVREPALYRDHVVTAENLARALGAIVAEARVVAVRSDEDVARELLLARQRADQLASEVAGLETTVDAKDRGLARALIDHEFNVALNRAREGLDPTDADVYREGDQLLIRLKSGADPTLTKVKGVIRELNARDVRVQGGSSTDAAAVAQSLSEVTEVARTVDPAVPPSAPVEVLIRPQAPPPQ